MQINVSQLLKASIGTTRDYEVNETIDITGGSEGSPVRGDIKLIRTLRGILVKGLLRTEVYLSCSRCLSPFRCTLSLDFQEEYVPLVDVNSGAPLPVPEDPTSFTIDEHHTLDLTEAIRQYTMLAIPMKPLCLEQCAGLCHHCGRNLNEGPCDCPAPETDPRLASLTRLLRK